MDKVRFLMSDTGAQITEACREALEQKGVEVTVVEKDGNTDSVRLQSVTETNPKVVDKLYMRYNAERIAKEVGANTIGYVSKLGNKTVSECTAYMERKMNDYLS